MVSEANPCTGGEEVEILELRKVLQGSAHRVVLVGEPELHGGRIDVLDHAHTPVR